ncbi:MAG: TIM barrel protein [Armatimonas sp.]
MRVIEQAGVNGVAILADLFHMHIEETNSPQALINAAAHVKHIHLADNTRMELGTGDIDLVAAFTALKSFGFMGYMAYECSITGTSETERATNLAKSLSYVKACIEKA